MGKKKAVKKKVPKKKKAPPKLVLRATKVRDELRALCHVKGCEDPDDCPENHDDCNEQLSLRTKVIWEAADLLVSLAGEAENVLHRGCNPMDEETYRHYLACDWAHDQMREHDDVPRKLQEKMAIVLSTIRVAMNRAITLIVVTPPLKGTATPDVEQVII